ncbi:MAG: flagellar biosynthesis regulator FlaF [Pseudomonadota bacterium]
MSPRELESDLLLKAAAKLQTEIDDWSLKGTRETLEHTLLYNRKLWQVFVTSVTADENPLPKPLKESIASLGVFVFACTMDALKLQDPKKMMPVININRQIAAGLRGQ